MDKKILNDIKELYIKLEIAKKEAEEINRKLEKLENQKEDYDFEYNRSGINHEQEKINSIQKQKIELSLIESEIERAKKEKEERELRIKEINNKILIGLGTGLSLVGLFTILPTTEYFPDLVLTPVYSALITGGAFSLSFMTSLLISNNLEKKNNIEYKKRINGKNKLGKNLIKERNRISSFLAVNHEKEPVQVQIINVQKELNEKLEEIKELIIQIREYEKKYDLEPLKLTEEDYEYINSNNQKSNDKEYKDDPFESIFAEFFEQKPNLHKK